MSEICKETPVVYTGRSDTFNAPVHHSIRDVVVCTNEMSLGELLKTERATLGDILECAMLHGIQEKHKAHYERLTDQYEQAFSFLRLARKFR